MVLDANGNPIDSYDPQNPPPRPLTGRHHALEFILNGLSAVTGRGGQAIVVSRVNPNAPLAYDEANRVWTIGSRVAGSVAAYRYAYLLTEPGVSEADQVFIMSPQAGSRGAITFGDALAGDLGFGPTVRQALAALGRGPQASITLVYDRVKREAPLHYDPSTGLYVIGSHASTNSNRYAQAAIDSLALPASYTETIIRDASQPHPANQLPFQAEFNPLRTRSQILLARRAIGLAQNQAERDAFEVATATSNPVARALFRAAYSIRQRHPQIDVMDALSRMEATPTYLNLNPQEAVETFRVHAGI